MFFLLNGENPGKSQLLKGWALANQNKMWENVVKMRLFSDFQTLCRLKMVLWLERNDREVNDLLEKLENG